MTENFCLINNRSLPRDEVNTREALVLFVLKLWYDYCRHVSLGEKEISTIQELSTIADKADRKACAVAIGVPLIFNGG